MKKNFRTLTIAAIAGTFCALLWGNVSAQPTFELGVKAGLGLAKLTGDDTKMTEDGVIDLGDGYYGQGTISQTFDESKLGFVGGIYATLQINQQFGIRLEGLYT